MPIFNTVAVLSLDPILGAAFFNYNWGFLMSEVLQMTLSRILSSLIRKLSYKIPSKKPGISSAFHVNILLENTFWVIHWRDRLRVGSEKNSSFLIKHES